jgi:maltose alpha-D-glucosyltransferase/alpha-amylase
MSTIADPIIIKPSGKKSLRNLMGANSMWYKSGVIYELHVRTFQDSDGDGTGDFPGLTSRLDYLRDLGITAIWLLPFYPSPLKDDGYDIADYCSVHAMYGTLADFKTFLDEAHRRGLRVITELVLNHTSDQHPWFQRARRAAPGSKFRDYYVWNDSPDKYKRARIIFKDTEISNWTWDAKASAFYWHRFFSHQPDLNFENAAVHEEMIKVIDFWLDLGVDGVRLDAVPYLYEAEDTNCENLTRTHDYLKKLRAHVDEKYGDRMLLAEANQWPEDAVAYFGSGRGDECHMAFHFPLMPRLFMSLSMEDRVPIVDILEQTPPIPETAQWALFLRNHDELTLEMVTDEERDYMYRMYAHVQQARLNLGIRRRLAPLVGNDRKRIELLTALLFSLPGTPVIYYGDEIGMGENIYLGDRNGVRTPMQWSSDKNAGFSRANPQSLFLPINLDPENHYEAVNVEVQERNNYSLLWWMRRLIALYKRQRAFGRGSIEFLNPENRKIFACIRRFEDEIILVVANLSRFVQPVELDLSVYQSLIPIELFGRTEFPPLSEKPLFLTLGPHAFYWLSLERKPTKTDGAPIVADLISLSVEERWEDIFDDRHHIELELALQRWLPSQRWFCGKGQIIKSVRVRETIRTPMDSGSVMFAFIQVDYVQANSEIYVVPMAVAAGEAAATLTRDLDSMVICRLNLVQNNETCVICDGITNRDFGRALFRLLSDQERLSGKLASIEASHTAEFENMLANRGSFEIFPSNSGPGNPAFIFGENLILNFFRRLEPGINPALELSSFLSAQKFPYSPQLAGALQYRNGRQEPGTVAILTNYIPKAKGAWEFTLDALGKFYERVQTLPPEKRLPQIPGPNITRLASGEVAPQVKDLLDTYAESARLLGERTAAMHLALALETENPRFIPEPFTPHAQRALFQSLRNLTRQNFQLLNRQSKKLPADLQVQARQILALEPDVLKKFRRIYEQPLDAMRIRQHGDYHLGRVLHTGKDFLIIDFEGEPSISISERQLKHSPMLDVAGMVRSFHYAAQAALSKHIERGTPMDGQGQQWARFWAWWVSAIFYKAYLQTAGTATFLPPNDADRQLMTEVFLLRKAIYELGYELNNHPDRLNIPIQGILELMTEQNPSLVNGEMTAQPAK